MRAALLSIVAAAFACGALLACTHDFGQFQDGDGDASAATDATSGGDANPRSDAAPGQDSSTTQDAGPDSAPDTGCTPSATCLGNAKTCATKCVNDFTTCINNCGNSNGCKANCKNKETNCLVQCNFTCQTCTQQAGCPAVLDCADAAASD